MRISLDHVHRFATDLPATVRCFESMLGATVVWAEDAAGVRAMRRRIGHAFVHIYEQPPKAPRGSGCGSA